MGFDYGRGKNGKDHSGQDSMWTSYSDLFLGLSIIFLLLYVSASLKQGTDGIRQSIENKQLAKQAEDLKQQIKVYETLKQDYLKTQASVDEQANYEELMQKLELLQDEAKDEKSKLIAQANENEKKAAALNKYQQMIRNIINSNMIAKSRIKNRDTMIDQKDEVIVEKNQEIQGLEKTVSVKSEELRKGEARIGDLEGQLDQRLNQLRASYKAQKITKQKFEEQQRQIQAEAESKIAAMREANSRAQAELDQAARELAETNSRLNKTANQLSAAQGTVSKLEGELQAASGRHQAEVSKLQGAFEAQKAKERGEFEAAIAREKLSGAQRAAREAAFKAEAERKAKDLEGRIAGLDQKFRATQAELARAQENLNARKKLASDIKKNFKKVGVKADVDEHTGDVLLSFGDNYFKSDSSDLKPQMREILEQAMPAYSASLFEDVKISSKIKSVEIVGFASPTYGGKFVDPKSLDPKDRQAVNYNLDLSYRRARSIFNFVFDKNRIQFRHQERLLPLVNVTGRSFLASENNRDPAAQHGAEAFCQKNDCAKLQRVIIKFTLKD